jgi:hypothetical protein
MEKNKQVMMYDRPIALPSQTWVYNFGCGEKIITITYNENNEPVEIFMIGGKEGTCLNTAAACVGKICSGVLRANHDPQMKEHMLKMMVKNLSEMRCDNGIWDDANYLKSCYHAIAVCLQESFECKNGYWEDGKFAETFVGR